MAFVNHGPRSAIGAEEAESHLGGAATSFRRLANRNPGLSVIGVRAFQCSVTAMDPVGGAEVKGVVTGPDGNLFYVTLYDDGLAAHGDEAANDGVYSASFVPL
ncbi:MAG: hypothetical protein QOE70_2866 [Chthoniobacter sp.]|nr:hypothetical protein [Chthoniobacter sp.]